ncbi:MAG: hypothetical protein LDL25_00110 [Hyphomicrobiales bacterium]|uniref:hypothetical protein n=1 Tax=Rhabdaerophilum calidifontis TaxID=2604328 RepID=UPI00123B471A|nr:hypothetical protein [Rhabdaerophilum calidifontis]MCA1952500.1 hypothetical protein [Hyphomicrobiales bacterium]MCA1998165.1 hypothetical protein [Hyphomicrobiales bacterium]
MVQTLIRHGRGLLREALPLLLCAFIALSGVIEARALAQRAASEPGIAFALCMSGQKPDDVHAPVSLDERSDPDQAPAAAHDCATCCLPAQPALAPRLATILPPHAPAGLPAERVDTPVAHAEPHILPWSRGPPGRA